MRSVELDGELIAGEGECIVNRPRIPAALRNVSGSVQVARRTGIPQVQPASSSRMRPLRRAMPGYGLARATAG